MNEKLIEIIVWFMSQLHFDSVEEPDISSLLEKGFSDKEISTAFSWITDKIKDKNFNEIQKLQYSPTHIYRFLSADERELFTEEAFVTIQQLQALRLITNEHLNSMIEQASLFGIRKIDADMVKQYIAMFIFSIPPFEQAGSRTTLYNEDSIN